MNTHLTISTSPVSNRYWRELKDLNDSVKLELITLLSHSLTHAAESKQSPTEKWADRFCGAWKDSRSAEEIVSDIRSFRTANDIDVQL